MNDQPSQKAYDDLFHRAVLGDFSVEFLEEARSLLQIYRQDPGLFDLQIRTENLIGFIYRFDGRESDYFDIAMKHLKELKADHKPHYPLAVISAINSAAIAGRENEVNQYVFNFLVTRDKDFYYTIPALYWYIGYPVNDAGFDDLEETLVIAAREMGFVPDAFASFPDRVAAIYHEWNRACTAKQELDIACAKASAEERKVLVENYLEKEALSFYKRSVRMNNER